MGEQAMAHGHPAILTTRDVRPYFLRKVRILNAAHTALVNKAMPRGLRTVRQAVLSQSTPPANVSSQPDPVRPPTRHPSRRDRLTRQLENDRRCATGTSGPVAHIDAHIIFPGTSVIFEVRHTPFCQLRIPFWQVAHTFCWRRTPFWQVAHIISGPRLIRAILPVAAGRLPEL
jgi:hypothetical protein